MEAGGGMDSLVFGLGGLLGGLGAQEGLKIRSEWILSGFFMDFGWILGGFSMDFGCLAFQN